jgi:hypothetical protein
MDSKKYIYGGISGIIESCVSHPFDYYKIHTQANIFQSQFQTKSRTRIALIPFFINTVHTHGFGALYTGFIPKIISIIPTRIIFWGVQSTTLYHLQNPRVYCPSIKNKKIQYITAGSVAGFCQTLVETPMEIVKIRLMTKKQTLPGLSYLIKNAYNGFRWNASRNMIFCSAVCMSNNTFREKNEFSKFFINSSAAFLISIVTQPLDFMKTMYQANEKSEQISIRQAIKKYKWRLFNGSFARAYTGAINMGVGALVFNKLVQLDMFIH